MFRYLDICISVYFYIFRDENYCTALLLAASKGHVKVMKLLIENLAEVNVSDKLKVNIAENPSKLWQYDECSHF